MKRHEALIPLSHDHHHGLVVALRLKKGAPASPNDNWPQNPKGQRDALMKFAESELFPHFLLEEELLFPVCLNASGELRTVTAELMAEHKSMRATIDGLRNSEDESYLMQQMSALGTLLESHIRKEERTYFPLAEAGIEAGSLSIDLEAVESQHAAYSPLTGCDT